MLHRCAECSVPVFSTMQMLWATTITPLKCPRCGTLNVASWWAVVVSIAATIGLIAAWTYALLSANWLVAILATIVAATALWGQHRYIPLAPISQRSVRLYRRIGLPLFVLFLVLWFWLMPEFPRVP
jgi:hypothetical protein